MAISCPSELWPEILTGFMGPGAPGRRALSPALCGLQPLDRHPSGQGAIA